MIAFHYSFYGLFVNTKKLYNLYSNLKHYRNYRVFILSFFRIFFKSLYIKYITTMNSIISFQL
ncbi:hypothetical protein CKU37_11325 [Streptococcus salivarius]|uniref:Uncharacterized protein n=1 Tax=Streptococcus salivarius TaxID=1304 RepID=A0AA45HT82_STRSL|nr:hypothetical protein CKU37_11325 [Streptococcus salivarius]